jgi:HlyD family secretion protein
MSTSSAPAVVPQDLDTAADWRTLVRQAWFLIAVVFGLGGLWGAVARLDSGAVATGLLAAESSRKTVQHFEGGIVRDILVRDGDTVDKDQLLLRLDDTQARAGVETLRKQLAASLAEEARLVAERDNAAAIVFPAEVLSESRDTIVARAMADQTAQFRDRRANILGQVEILQARMGQAREEIAGTQREKEANEEQVQTIRQELGGLRMLLEKNLVQLPRVLSLEREQSRLKGAIGRAEAEMSKAQQAMGETQLQISQIRQQFLESVSKDLPAVRKTIGDLRERLKAQEDILRRTDIRAPQGGVVQSLKVFTVGGVARPGEALMDIAPLREDLVVRAQISPMDVDSVKLGDRVEIRFPSFSTRKPPLFFGTLKRLSRDRIVDDTTQNRPAYFAAEIGLDRDSIPPEFGDKLVSGMQADVIVTTGERTALQYLLNPLLERIGFGMREH